MRDDLPAMLNYSQKFNKKLRITLVFSPKASVE